IEAFADSADEKVLLNLSAERLDGADQASLESIAAELRKAVPSAESILIQDRKADRFELFGQGFLTYTAAGAQYRVGHLSFFQVNRFMVENLVEAVIGESRGRLAVDLFAGVGLFSVALTSRFERVIGVESNLAAAKDLEVTLQASGGKSLTHRHTTAEAFSMHFHEKPDLIVVDPPRAGLEPDLIARLKKIAPLQINYVSCDPATLARDLS